MPLTAYVNFAFVLIVAAVALFVPAGTVSIASFWLYLAILAAFIVASLTLLDPELIRERMRPGGKPLPLHVHLVTPALILLWIVAGLDRGRLHWSDTVPPFLQGVGLAAAALGLALAVWAMVANPFFSSVVRIQSDRGHHVISRGPYRWVRHPGYAGAILFIFGNGLALGSWIVEAAWLVLGTPFILYRSVTEDRLLQRDLPGYRDYAARVRWRLLPGVW